MGSAGICGCGDVRMRRGTGMQTDKSWEGSVSLSDTDTTLEDEAPPHHAVTIE